MLQAMKSVSSALDLQVTLHFEGCGMSPTVYCAASICIHQIKCHLELLFLLI